MNSEDFDDPGALAADRRENRRAVLVALIAVLVIGIASILLLIGQQRSTRFSGQHPDSNASSSSVLVDHGSGDILGE